MSKYKEIAKNTAIIAIGKMLTQFLAFLLLPLYTHYLTTKDYGTIDLIITYVSLISPVISLQLEMAVFRFLIDSRSDSELTKKIVSTVLLLTLLMTLAFSTILTLVLIRCKVPYGALITFTVIATIMSNLSLQIARGMGNNRQYTVGGVIAGTSTIILNIVTVAFYGMGVKGILLSLTLSNILCAVYLMMVLRIFSYFSVSFIQKSLIIRLLTYSVPLIPNGIAWWIINAADRSIIISFLGASANGIYAVAYKFPLIFSSFFTFFSLAWTEAASIHISSRERDVFFSRVINTSLSVFGSLSLIILTVVPFVFNILVNDQYKEAYLYIPLIMIGMLFNSVVMIYSSIYIAHKLTNKVAKTSLMAALISVVLTLALIKPLGLYAACLSMVVAYFAMIVYRFIDLRKYVMIKYDLRRIYTLAALYAIALLIYYLRIPALDVINILLVSVASFVINRADLVPIVVWMRKKII